MPRKIGVAIFWLLVLGVLVFNAVEVQLINKKISSFESKAAHISGEEGAVEGQLSDKQKRYEITLEMWQTFEQEMIDYKQRLKEGKQFYGDQQSSWGTILADCKKNLQDYDKFITAEGDFWEKQLKSYDKLLAKIEERYDVLGQVADDLRGTVQDIQNTLASIQQAPVSEEADRKFMAKEKENTPERASYQVEPQIQGSGEYKTYPPQGSVGQKEGNAKDEQQQGPQYIRGSVSGTGEYKTY